MVARGIPTALGVVVTCTAAVGSFVPAELRVNAVTSLYLSPLGVQLIGFLVLVALAIVQRKRPQPHKRFIIAASVSILSPALGRFANHLAALGVAPTAAFEIIDWTTQAVMLVLLAAIVIRDKLTLQRVLPATWLSVALPGLGEAYGFARLLA